jgi:FkbM family methyltransferase
MPQTPTSIPKAYALFRLANRLHRRWPSLYLPLYEAYKRASDRVEMRAIRELVRPGMTCLDVGANVGVYTSLLARLVGPAGRVFAFEPSPENHALLARRGLGPNVEAIRAAAGASNGVVMLHQSSAMNVDHRTYPTDEARDPIPVPLVRLDEAVRGADVDFVKMDIQGYELQALRGMAGILAGRRPLAMILEFWPWGIRMAGDDPGALIRLLGSAGLSVRLLDGQPVDGWNEGPSWYRNLLAARA